MPPLQRAASPVAEPTETQLREQLLAVAAVISRRRPDLVLPDVRERLMQRGWLEWHFGAVRLTAVGVKVRDEALLGPAMGRSRWIAPLSWQRRFA